MPYFPELWFQDLLYLFFIGLKMVLLTDLQFSELPETLYASSLFRSSIKMVKNEWFWTTDGPPFISGPSSSSP